MTPEPQPACSQTPGKITPENVSGLVVGEGCFYAESAPDVKYRSGWRVRPGFCIELRSDDRPVLEEVRRHLGCGDIYELDFGRYRGYEKKSWKPHCKYRVTRIRSLHEQVVPFFERHPLFGRKAEAFAVFTRLVEHLAARRHRSAEGVQIAAGLAADLSRVNGRARSTD
jgi:hypothetical protein